jgi:serine/threonine protein kinase
MLTGLPPFESDNISELYEKIVKEPPLIPIGVDPAAESLILLLLDKDPAKRPGFEGIAAHPLFAGMDWDVIAQRGYAPEWRPVLDSLGICRANFDPALANEPLVDSEGPCADGVNIEGFSFMAPFPVPTDEQPILLPSELIEEYEKLADDLDGGPD